MEEGRTHLHKEVKEEEEEGDGAWLGLREISKGLIHMT